MDISKASLSNLYDLGRLGGRMRLKESKGVCTLYISPKQRLDLQNRAEKLAGFTTAKRQNVLRAVKKVCERNGLEFGAVMRNTGLTPEELRQVFSYKTDLKAQDLNAALSKFVRFNDHWLEMDQKNACGEGAYGKVFSATNGEQWFALKSAKPLPGKDKVESGPGLSGLQHEALVHADAGQVKPGQASHVLQSFGIVEGVDGTQYQALELAITDAERLVERQEVAMASAGADPHLRQAFLERSAATPELVVTTRDWLDGLKQTASKGIAHRDIKPANFLLTPEGRWKLTDFGTSGDADHEFAPRERTGNDNSYAKSPEWLLGEAGVEASHEVGLKDDVFSFGVAAYGLLTGGQRPFDGVAPPKFSSEYIDNVQEYAASKSPFSEWHEAHTGRAIPQAWKPMLDGALHSDPRQRLTASQLRSLALFEIPEATVHGARAALVGSFLPD